MKSDLERLQGNWDIVGLEMEGRKMPAMGGKISVKGERFTTSGMGATYEGKVEVNSNQSPKVINLIFDSGPEEGGASLGIFEFEDDDTWKICLTTQGGDRPMAFSTQPGTGHAFEVLKREGTQVNGAASAAAAEVAPSDPEHLAPLQGQWSMESGVMDGNPLDKSFVKSAKRVTQGNETSVVFGPQVFMKAKFTVDPSKTPKTIDLAHSEGGAKGQMQLGIYEVEGDVLRLALATPGSPRPTDFSATAGDGRTVVSWKRIKK
jgi:uncharacterized protein (TIGR03067 family)